MPALTSILWTRTCDIIYGVQASSDSSSPPTIGDLRRWLVDLRAWGRWGADDDRGTLNHIGDTERSEAAATVSLGRAISCALRANTDTVATSELNPTSTRVQRIVTDDATRPAPAGERVVAYDAFLVAPHGPILTHLDAPRHTVIDGVSYNGIPAGSPGVKGTIEAASDGILGRGVLLDVPGSLGRPWLDDGEAIVPADLERAEFAAGVQIRRGDILFVRTGYRARQPSGPLRRHAPRPGLQAACLPWLADREVAVVASDVAVDVIPHGYDEIGLPIHAIGMWAMGLWLIDNCGLELLAETCAELNRWAFLAVVAPLRIQDATASPVNPLAVF